MFLDQSKKGIEAGGFSIIIAIILLLLSAGVIVAGVKYLASKADESLQVELCRDANAIKFGLKERSSNLLTSGEPTFFCSTIDKITQQKSHVPTSKFKQDKEGAELEIREMIKNCWYMWLDGSKPNMFSEYPFKEPCFTCYNFKIKDNANGITFNSLQKSLDDSYYAKDTSDKCAVNGGYWRATKCEPDENEVTSRKTPPNTGYKCCAKDVNNECENKGGKCSSTGKPSEEYALYNKWKCLKSDQNCYVKRDAQYSYTRYIREFGSRGGDVFFMPPNGQQATDMSFVPGEIYSINFISPSKQFCYKGLTETSAGCYLGMGTYTLAAGVLVKAGAVGTVAVGSVKSLSLLGIKGGVATVGLYKLGILGNIAQGLVDFIAYPITDEVPNFIIVSTQNDARELGCILSYAE